MILHVAGQRAMDDIVYCYVHQGRKEPAIGKHAGQLTRLQTDQHRLFVVAVNNAWDAPRTPGGPGGPLSGLGARLRAQGGYLGHGSSLLITAA